MLRLVSLSSVNTDDVSSQREEKATDSTGVVKDFVNTNKDGQSYNIYEKVSLFVSSNNHYDKHQKKEIIDRITTQLYAINQKTGAFYGFIPQEQEDFFCRIFRSTDVEISLDAITSTIDVYSEINYSGSGSKISAKLGFTQMAKTIFSHFIDSLISELLLFRSDMLVNNASDSKKRASVIAAKLSVGSFGYGFEKKLVGLLEENFVSLINENVDISYNLKKDSHNKTAHQWVCSIIYDVINSIFKEK